MDDMDRRRFLLAAAGLAAELAVASDAVASKVRGVPLVLVTADRESHVVVLDPADARVVARVRTLAGPRSIEAVAGGALVAHTQIGRVSLLDAESVSVRRVVDGFHAPRYTAAYRDPVEALAYVTDSNLREVVAVDVARGSVVARASVPGPARHVTLGPRGDRLWTALGPKAEHVAVLDTEAPRRPRLARTIAPPFLAHDVVFTPDGRHVWVTSGAKRRLAVYEADGRTPVAVLDADAPPQHIAFVGGLAFVASGDDGTVRVHRSDGTLVYESHVPVGSYNVTFGWRRAVTPSLERGTVSLLDERGRVRAVRKVALAAHDACVITR
jgi:DNA-binding beta-propeller fold protein YncE